MSPVWYFVIGTLIGGGGVGLLIRYAIKKVVENAVGRGLNW